MGLGWDENIYKTFLVSVCVVVGEIIFDGFKLKVETNILVSVLIIAEYFCALGLLLLCIK